jgi:CheY-like chemotaxis protein
MKMPQPCATGASCSVEDTTRPHATDDRLHQHISTIAAEARAVENGSKGVQTAKAGQIDLVIMDVGLQDIDGREAVRILRKNGFKAPKLAPLLRHYPDIKVDMIVDYGLTKRIGRLGFFL